MVQKQDLSSDLKKLLPELMSLKNKAQGRISKDADIILERRTESVLIEPFLKIFGYIPSSVSPNRLEAGFSIGRNIADFALLKDGKVVIVIEAKRVGTDLSRHHQQLNLYFNTTDKNNRPKFGILTNGEQYHFYTATDNIMDNDPCFTFNLSIDFDNEDKVGKLAEILFNINEEIAQNEKLYTNTRSFIERVFKQTDDEKTNEIINAFVRDGILNVAKKNKTPLHNGHNITPEDIEKTKQLIVQIFNDIINDNISQRFDSFKQKLIPHEEQATKKDQNEFTEQEQQALLIIQAIAAEIPDFDVTRISEYDLQGYCHIIMDGQSRNKKICTLYFNNPQKLSISINNPQPSDNSPQAIKSPADIYQYKEELKQLINRFI